MQCPRCGHGNPEDSRYCGACGKMLSDRSADERILRAFEYVEQGHTDQARGVLSKITEDEPWYHVAQRILGGILYRQGQIGAGAAALRIAGGNETFADAWYDLGVALYHGGDVEGAEAAYRKCLELDPTYHAAHYRLGVTLYHLGRLDEALKAFEKAQLLTPEYAMAAYHIGVILGRLGRFEEAKTQLESYLEYHPWDAPTKYHLGMLSARFGDTEAARKYLAGLPEFKAGIPAFPKS